MRAHMLSSAEDISLRVQAADLANHAYEIGRCSSLHEVMALHPPGEGLLPREVAPSSEFRHQFFA
jgi:hypothetical protein